MIVIIYHQISSNPSEDICAPHQEKYQRKTGFLSHAKRKNGAERNAQTCLKLKL